MKAEIELVLTQQECQSFRDGFNCFFLQSTNWFYPQKIKLQQNVHVTRKTALNLIENRHNPEQNNEFDHQTRIILTMQS